MYENEILQSAGFRTAMERLAGDRPLVAAVQKQLQALAQGDITPGMDRMRVGRDPLRPIFKIRVNASDRLIYEGPLRVTDIEQPVIYIHEIGRHDEIERMIQRALGRPPALEDLEEQRTEGLQPEPIDSCFSGIRLAYRIPWPAYLDPDKFDILMGNLASALRLTPAQQTTLKAGYPVLIQGQAGSGKSVVLSHHLALHMYQDVEQGASGLVRLCVSYNKKLVEKAARDVEAILQAAYGLDTIAGGTRFLPYRDLLSELIPNAAGRFEERHRVSWVRFREGFCANRTLHVSPELAWHAIRSFFKGACLPPGRPPLTLEAYEQRGRRFRELLEQRQIRTLYDLARRYEDWLASEELWDDLDLAWYALKWLQQTDGPRYAEIYCDEAQDLTELDFGVLIRLSKIHWEGPRPRVGLILAGDPLQTIHPSGFRWAMVKDRIFEAVKRQHGVELSIGASALAENWRSDGAIVQLANEIQQLRRRYIDEVIPSQEAQQPASAPPMLAPLPDQPPRWLFDNLLAQLPPSCGIVVREEPDKKELLDANVPPDRVYTVMEAKGLEFDVAVLWRPAEGDDSWWSLLAAGTTGLSENQRIPLLYLLNRLYVSVTRGVKAVFLLDSAETIERRWRSLFESVLRVHPFSDLEHHPDLRREAVRSEWKNWARILEDREEFDRAAISYEKAKEIVLSDRCRAKGHRVRGEHASAAALFERTGDLLEAAEAYFDAKLWPKAHSAASRSPEGVPAQRLAARAFFHWKKDSNDLPLAVGPLLQAIASRTETEPMWLRYAAHALRELGRNEEAGELFHQTQDFEAAARCFLNCRRWEDALSAFIKAGSEESGRYQAEGEIEALAGNWSNAIECFRRARQWQRMFDCCTRSRDALGQVEALRRLGRVQEAIAILEASLASPLDASRKKELWEQLKVCAFEIQDWKRARQAARELENLFEEANYAEKAGEDPTVVKRLRAKAHLKERQYLEAARLLDELGDRQRADEATAKGRMEEKKFLEAAEIYGRLLFVRSYWKCHREGIKRAQGLRDDVLLDEQAATEVFEWLATLKPNDWRELESPQHEQDRNELAELCRSFPHEFGEAWKIYPPDARTAILAQIADVAKVAGIDVDALDFIAAILAREPGKLTWDERRRLIDALEDATERPLPWRKRFSPQEMGRAWECIGNHLKTAKWYEELFEEGIEEAWVLEAALAARCRQRDLAFEAGNMDQTERIDRRIKRLKHQLAELTLADDP